MPTGELARRDIKLDPADWNGLTEDDLCDLFDVTPHELQHGIEFVDDHGDPLPVPLPIRGLHGLADFERFAGIVPTTAGPRTRIEPFQRLILLGYFLGYTEIWTLIPKGNGKTSLLALLLVYHLLVVNAPEVPVGAALINQAKKIYTETSRVAALPRKRAKLGPKAKVPWKVPMPWKDPPPEEGYEEVLLQPLNGYLSIRVGEGTDDTEGVLRILASDKLAGGDEEGSGVLEGSGATLGVAEEVHAHKTGAIVASIQGGLDKRKGQLFGISTVGRFLDSLLGKVRARFRSHGVVRKVPQFGKLTVSRIGRTAILFEWGLEPDVDDIEDLDVVKQANPASFVTRVGLASTRSSPSMSIPRWKRYHCGLWTADADGWLDGREEWDANVELDHQLAPGDEIYLGTDPAWSYDTFSIVGLKVIGDPGERRFHAQRIACLRPQHGKTVSPDQVEIAINDARETYQVLAMGHDKNRGFAHIVRNLSDDGLTCVVISMRGETWVPLTSELRTAVSTPGQWTHAGDELYTAHVLSGETKDTADGERLHGRTKSKVDLLMATGIAHVTAFGLREDTTISSYQQRGSGKL